MFADDVSLFSSRPNKEVAEAAIQEAITNVAEWSRCRKLTLNTSTCEVAFFTNNSTGPCPSDRMSPQWFPKPLTDVECSPH